MRNRNILRCPNCGFEVLSEAIQRDCAKCEKAVRMDFICKEEDYEGGTKRR